MRIRAFFSAKCRIKGFRPTYLPEGRLVQNQTMHLGVANTMASVRERWWIPKLFYRNTGRSGSRPFEVTSVDFAGPLSYIISTKEQGKCYLIIFTCASSRAVHLEPTEAQTADEFQRKLNGFISPRTRSRMVISDNATVFKATAA